jgi:ArsR family transcriptional regulator
VRRSSSILPSPRRVGRADQLASALRGRRADAEIADLARALAHPLRVRVLRALARRGALFAWQIGRGLGVAKSTLSTHLGALAAAGLVEREEDGKLRRYSVDPRALRRLGVLTRLLCAERPPRAPEDEPALPGWARGIGA